VAKERILEARLGMSFGPLGPPRVLALPLSGRLRSEVAPLLAVMWHVLLLAELKELGAHFQNETLAKPRDSPGPQIKPASDRRRPSKSDR
jgi:hypothetical protein